MPYISIKSWPKDDAVRAEAIRRVSEVFVEVWGCPPEALTVSSEIVQPEDWAETVVKAEIEPKMDKVMILKGQETEALKALEK